MLAPTTRVGRACASSERTDDATVRESRAIPPERTSAQAGLSGARTSSPHPRRANRSASPSNVGRGGVSQPATTPESARAASESAGATTVLAPVVVVSAWARTEVRLRRGRVGECRSQSPVRSRRPRSSASRAIPITTATAAGVASGNAASRKSKGKWEREDHYGTTSGVISARAGGGTRSPSGLMDQTPVIVPITSGRGSVAEGSATWRRRPPRRNRDEPYAVDPGVALRPAWWALTHLALPPPPSTRDRVRGGARALVRGRRAQHSG